MHTSFLKALPGEDASFQQIREGNFAYVDKTRFIRELEERRHRFPLIVRPHGFGKKLFTSTLQAYYDQAQAGNFEKFFQDLDIGRHPTSSQGQFFVLHFDFSGIDVEHLIPQFNQRLEAGFTDFFRRYPELRKPAATIITPLYPVEYLNAFLMALSRDARRRLYVLIDEYDHFADQRFTANPRAVSETSFLTSFYSRLKEATEDSLITRIFITGVTPFSLDFMTSGFCIADDISRIAAFSDLCGFTETELSTLIDETVDFNACRLSRQDVLARLLNACKDTGLTAASHAEPVYNASVCLNYLRSLSRSPD